MSCTKRGVPSYQGHQLSGQTAPLDMVFVEGQGKIPSFYVGRSEEPNINYVAYLSWLKNVFVDYPEVYKDAKIKFNKGGSTTRFNDPSLVYHMEHPAFAYYPIVGATWHQIQQYLTWKTDRLNEDILIQTGIYNEDFDQMNEENFNTESYLYDQYRGTVNKPITDKSARKLTRSVQWEDGILFAGYRLPTEAEWELLTDESNENMVESNYPYGKKYPYLRWLRPNNMDSYDSESVGMADYNKLWKKTKPIKVDIDSYKNGIQGPYLSNKPSNVAGNVKEWMMDVYHDTAVSDWANMSEYFFKIGFETRSEKHQGVYDMDGIIDLKDSIGRLRFRILGVNSDGSPLWALHPIKRSAYQVTGYDTLRSYINQYDYYLETNVDSLYNRFKYSFRNTYLYLKGLNINGGGDYINATNDLKMLYFYLTRYSAGGGYPTVPVLKELDETDIDREVYAWVKRVWDKEMSGEKCAINMISFSPYYCNDTGMYTAILQPRFSHVHNDIHQQLKVVRGGTWQSPNHSNREYMMADSGSSDVGFRVVLPYTNMPVKSKYKVNWK